MHVTGVIGSCRWRTSNSLPLEHPPDPEDRAGAEDDVRQRAVRGHDHRASDRDHVGGRVAVAADSGVQGARELTGWVVAHHQPHLVPARLERLAPGARRARRRRPRTTTRTAPRCRSSREEIVFTRRSRREARAPRGRRAGCSSSSSNRSRKRARTPARWVGPRCLEPAFGRRSSSSALSPRRSASHRVRSTEPARTSRSTSRVSPLWLRSTAPARSDMRSRLLGESLERTRSTSYSCSERPWAARSSRRARGRARCARGASHARRRAATRMESDSGELTGDVCICNYIT